MDCAQEKVEKNHGFTLSPRQKLSWIMVFQRLRPACASSISNTAITTIQHPLLDSHKGRSINML
jgi:hypothetical protein